jgi:hypothetical protein
MQPHGPRHQTRNGQVMRPSSFALLPQKLPELLVYVYFNHNYPNRLYR